MSKIEITPEMMNSIAKDLGQKIEEWNTAVKTVYSLHAELDVQFEGEANARLNARMAEDQPKYNALSELMTSYTNEIIKASADYVAADQEAATAIRQ
ncbi:MAG: WXG100 family type VII secretion target [Eubacterium sp.]|nr:WXG100 family type VII secretion target [Eubacterium sp.]